MLRKYISASSITVATSVLTKAIAFLEVAVLTRLTSTEEYGEFSLFISYVTIVTLIIGGSVSSSFGIAKRDFGDRYDAYVSSMLGFSYLMIAVSFILYFLFFSVSWGIFLAFVLIHSFNLNILTNYDVKCSFNFEFKKAAVIALLTALSGLVACVIAVSITGSGNKGQSAIIAVIISSGMVSLFCQYKLWKAGKLFFDKEFWKYAAKNSFILVPHNLSLVILNQMDRIMIGELLSNSYVAIYSAIYSLSVVISILWISIKKVWATWAYGKMKEKNVLAVRKVDTILIIAMILGVINYCFITPEIIKIFLPVVYWDGTTIMAPILFGYFFSFLFSIYVNIEYFHSRTKIIMVGTILAAAVNIISNYFFIPIYGYKISAYTTLLSYFVLFFYHYLYNIRTGFFSHMVLWGGILFLSIFLLFFQWLLNSLLIRYFILLLIDSSIFVTLYIFALRKNVPTKVYIRNLIVRQK